jgi:hypothetical protein
MKTLIRVKRKSSEIEEFRGENKTIGTNLGWKPSISLSSSRKQINAVICLVLDLIRGDLSSVV